MTSPDEGPEWADEAHLDEVFSTWVPGPPESASAAEREMAGDNSPLEIPVDEEVSDQDLEAAIAAAMAEAEGASAPEWQPVPDWEPAPEWQPPQEWQPAHEQFLPAEEPPPPPPPPSVPRRSEPAGPAWLNMPTPEDARGPGPVPAASPTTPEPVVPAEPEPEPSQPHASEPVAPASPPEPTKVARPWTRSDDDILPGRRGKGRRR